MCTSAVYNLLVLYICMQAEVKVGTAETAGPGIFPCVLWSLQNLRKTAKREFKCGEFIKLKRDRCSEKVEPQSKPGLVSLHQLHSFFAGCLKASCKSFLTFKRSIMHGEEAKNLSNLWSIFFQSVTERVLGLYGLCISTWDYDTLTFLAVEDSSIGDLVTHSLSETSFDFRLQ